MIGQRPRRELLRQRVGLRKRHRLHARERGARDLERRLERTVHARPEPPIGRASELIERERRVERRGNERQRQQREGEAGAQGHRAAREPSL